MLDPSPCLGLCDRAPAALLAVAGEAPLRARADTPSAESITRGPSAARAVAASPARRPPQAGEPELRLLRRVGRVDPGEPRRLPRPRRLRGAAARVRARAGGHDPRGRRFQARGPRRRRVPDGPQVEAVARAPARPHYLDLQRGRIRAGHVQGPRADGGRSVRADRSDDDRRLRGRLPSSGYIYVRGEYPLARQRLDGAIAQARARGISSATT